jgi:HK97 family phage portal protein
MGILTKAGSWIARNLGLTDSRLYGFTGGAESDAGERITVEGAMQLDVVWACVRRVAETIATLPLHLYVNDADGKATKARNHQLYTLLHDRPNIEMTSVEFWEAMVGCYMLWGNGYASIERVGVKIVALYPLRPDRVQIRRQPDGSISYFYANLSQSQEFQEDEIFHIKGFSLDGLFGLSPVGQARQVLGSTRAAERASGSFFRNGMRPSGFLKSPGFLTPAQRVDAKVILENFKGAGNTGGTPLLEGGWDWHALTIPPEEAQMLETRAFHVEQICRWFDMPPILVGHSGQTTWGSCIEQIMLGWLTLGLRSHLKRIEQAIWCRLLTGAEQSQYYAEFNVDALLRADSAGRALQMASLAQNGLRTRNELRALDNEPPIPGGDIATVQSNLLPLEKIGSAEHLASPLASQKPDAPLEKPSTGGTNIPGGSPHKIEG